VKGSKLGLQTWGRGSQSEKGGGSFLRGQRGSRGCSLGNQPVLVQGGRA